MGKFKSNTVCLYELKGDNMKKNNTSSLASGFGARRRHSKLKYMSALIFLLTVGCRTGACAPTGKTTHEAARIDTLKIYSENSEPGQSVTDAYLFPAEAATGHVPLRSQGWSWGRGLVQHGGEVLHRLKGSSDLLSIRFVVAANTLAAILFCSVSRRTKRVLICLIFATVALYWAHYLCGSHCARWYQILKETISVVIATAKIMLWEIPSPLKEILMLIAPGAIFGSLYSRNTSSNLPGVPHQTLPATSPAISLHEEREKNGRAQREVDDVSLQHQERSNVNTEPRMTRQNDEQAFAYDNVPVQYETLTEGSNVNTAPPVQALHEQSRPHTLDTRQMEPVGAPMTRQNDEQAFAYDNVSLQKSTDSAVNIRSLMQEESEDFSLRDQSISNAQQPEPTNQRLNENSDSFEIDGEREIRRPRQEEEMCSSNIDHTAITCRKKKSGYRRNGTCPRKGRRKDGQMAYFCDRKECQPLWNSKRGKNIIPDLNKAIKKMLSWIVRLCYPLYYVQDGKLDKEIRTLPETESDENPCPQPPNDNCACILCAIYNLWDPKVTLICAFRKEELYENVKGRDQESPVIFVNLESLNTYLQAFFSFGRGKYSKKGVQLDYRDMTIQYLTFICWDKNTVREGAIKPKKNVGSLQIVEGPQKEPWNEYYGKFINGVFTETDEIDEVRDTGAGQLVVSNDSFSQQIENTDGKSKRKRRTPPNLAAKGPKQKRPKQTEGRRTYQETSRASMRSPSPTLRDETPRTTGRQSSYQHESTNVVHTREKNKRVYRGIL